MKVSELCTKLNLKVLSSIDHLNNEISGGYCCDLLSRVMAVGQKDNLWITVQTHVNIIAIAVLLELSCIIIPEAIEVDSKAIAKAEEENIPILSTELNAYQLAGRLYQLGIHGTNGE